MHIYDWLEIVYVLPFLPNNSASETFLHKSGAVGIINGMFIIGVPAWRWMDECVTLDRMFYNLLFKQKKW